ncbi:ATP-grasp domain-containing protein [Aquabacterium sp. A7-Y]|uniref:ATP-grasp domain-containing protein n=1 Tax=Aquabacterium sp. A7-Y TaxID=1349605 RepID=UPI00223DFF07|nr:ATP-grasp domain-containing protein [Aquabacterium sp. A7-Y]MCW7536900.1 ATP-grasp domain-containing protein [Aquabacterium sp. A7-Y]
MRKYNRLGVLHAYPSRWMVEALKLDAWELVLVGPGPAEQYLALGANDALVVDLGRSEEVLAKLERYHEMRPFDALLPVYEGATVLTAAASARLGLPCYPQSAAVASRNKLLAALSWDAQGVPVPRTLPLPIELPDAEVWALIAIQFGGDAVLKLADSMNSQGVVRVRNAAECSRALALLRTMLGAERQADATRDRNRFAYGRGAVKLIVQEYCDGEEVGIDLVVFEGRHSVLGVFQKARSSGPCFGETLSVWPTSLGAAAEEELGRVAAQAVTALGARTAAAHVEIRYTRDGPKVLEAGLRPGGAYTVRGSEILTGVNQYRWLAAALTGGALEAPATPHGAVLYGGVVYPHSGVLKRVLGEEVFQEVRGLLDLQVLNRPGDEVFALPRSAQPHYCYYLLSGADRAAVLQAHEKIQSRLQPVVETREAA